MELLPDSGSIAQESTETLCARADRARRSAVGDRVFLRGLIEFSNHCGCNCLYCGLRRDNTALERYRLSDDDILASARAAAAAGADTIVLQSGEDRFFTKDHLAGLISRVKDATGLAVTLSAGNRSTEAFRLWKRAGADRYLIKHETADPGLYAALHPGDSLANRTGALMRLRDLGYEVGTGFIIGLPGAPSGAAVNDGAYAADIALIQEIEADMCGVGPFLPQANTPLADRPAGSVEQTLRVISLLRLARPSLNLPATTALASLAVENGQLLALKAGANVIMPSFTPDRERGKYRIYDGKTAVSMAVARRVIAEAGRVCGPAREEN